MLALMLWAVLFYQCVFYFSLCCFYVFCKALWIALLWAIQINSPCLVAVGHVKYCTVQLQYHHYRHLCQQQQQYKREWFWRLITDTLSDVAVRAVTWCLVRLSSIHPLGFIRQLGEAWTGKELNCSIVVCWCYLLAVHWHTSQLNLSCSQSSHLAILEVAIN